MAAGHVKIHKGEALKTVIGVDLGSLYAPALELAKRLEIPQQEFDLVHVVEPLPSYTPVFGPVAMTAVNWMGKLREAGDAETKRAMEAACERGAACKTFVIDGSPAASLIEHADVTKADMIAIGSARHDRVSAALFGSVGRGLTVGAKQSLLISKGDEVTGAGPLSVVFATDHSEYASRCLDLLISWAPQGIKKATVLSAYDLDEAAASRLQASLENVGADVERWVYEQMRSRSEEVAGKLAGLGIETDVAVERGHANEVIRKGMASGADLLVMGAQGHGFLKRLMIGSVSLHQVMNEPHPVLVLRA